MRVWIFKDAVNKCFDVCEEYVDCVGPGFVEAELDETFVRDFAKAEVAYGYFQVLLEDIWKAGQEKGKA